MKTITLRGIDDETATILKKRAKHSNTSVNATVLNLIRKSIGLEKKKRTRVYNDLNDLAGGWSKEEEQDFNERMRSFTKIDEELWK